MPGDYQRQATDDGDCRTRCNSNQPRECRGRSPNHRCEDCGGRITEACGMGKPEALRDGRCNEMLQRRLRICDWRFGKGESSERSKSGQRQVIERCTSLPAEPGLSGGIWSMS